MIYFILISTPTINVSLPNPELGDTAEFNNGFVNHLVMSGAIYTYKKTGTKRKVSLNFNLTTTEYNNFKAFYLLTCSQLLYYVDYEEIVWEGRILSNPFQGSQPNKNYKNISIEFEGVNTEIPSYDKLINVHVSYPEV